MARGLGEGEADGRSHERRGAWGGDDGGEDSGEEAAGVALLLASSPPTLVRERPMSKRPASESAKKKRPAARRAMKVGDWSWKPHPAWLPPARRSEQDADDGPEGDQDAEGVDEAVAAEAACALRRRTAGGRGL
jgi:hypothetical protein